MGEILPDGSIQSYFAKCKECGQDNRVNIQGQHSGPQELSARIAELGAEKLEMISKKP